MRWLAIPALLALGLIGPLILSTWYVLDHGRTSLESAFRFELNQKMDVLANGMRDPVWNLIPESGRPLLDSILKDPRVVRVTVTSLAQGNFLHAQKPEPSATRPVTLTRDIRYQDGKIGEVTVEFESASMYAIMDQQWRQIYAVGALQLLLSFAIILFVVWISGRLQRQRALQEANARLAAEIEVRHRAETALQEQQELLRGIINNSTSVIALKDLNGNFLMVNAAYGKSRGIPLEALTGTSSYAHSTANHIAAMVAQDQEVIERREVVTRERDTVLPDGTPYHRIVTTFPIINAEDVLTGVCTISTDITELKQAEDRLRQAHKMEAVGQLTGGVAHDFNNLLTAVLGNLELICDRVKDDKDLLQLAMAASEAGERGGDLTQRLLAFSRQQKLKTEAVDLDSLVQGMDGLLRRTLGEDIEIATVPHGNLWPCQADASQVQNALLNLAINARDAMPGGGKLAIHTSNAEFGQGQAAGNVEITPGEYVMLAVTDSGVGMTPGIQEHIFEPFFTTKDVGQGSGLGLSMVYGFVSQSGGHVDVDSAPDVGTTVRIYLPRAVDGTAPLKVEPAIEAELSNIGTVLVVDDDEEVRLTTKRLLENIGYSVTEASDGPAALAQLARDSKIDLMFTDVVMPGGMSGPALAKQVRRLYPDIKILFATGYAGGRSDVEEATKYNARLVTKPYRRRDLVEAIRHVMDSDAESLTLNR